MAVYRYPPRPNVHTTAPGDSAFDEESANPDSLIVGKNASLIADDAISVSLGILGGAWTVSIAGQVAAGGVNSGILVGAPIATRSTIGITGTGTVAGYTAITAHSPVAINNAGLISSNAPSDAAVQLFSSGSNFLTNSGQIQAPLHSISGSAGAEKILNRGLITGDIQLISGQDALTNSGKIFGDVGLGDGDDVLTNFRKVGQHVVSGSILSYGPFTGTVDLGAGQDTFRGGSRGERVMDGDGHDVISLGNGRDTYIATGATDTLDLTDSITGGKHFDYYDASQTTDGVIINLDKVGHNGSPFAVHLVTARNTASGSEVAGNFSDKIKEFEGAIGGDGNDLIYGSSGANIISGGGGFLDELYGFGGNDQLNGNAGFDFLAGGRGKDILTGGTENDIFGYSSIADSGPTKPTRDVITDFEDGTNRIDLRLIDANTQIPGDQAFDFIGVDAAFSGARGELRVRTIESGFLVEANVDSDKEIDFAIEVLDSDHSIVWSGTTGQTFDL